MPEQLAVWVGAKGLIEHPTSPLTVQDAVKTTVTRIYEGPYTLCQSRQPTIGQTFSDLPGDVLVVGSSCAKAPGGQDGIKGRLTINLETPYATTFETEWVEVDKALIANPRYWSTLAGNVSDGPIKLDLTDRSMIDSWEREDDVFLKLAFKFKVLQGSAVTVIGASPQSTANPTSDSPLTVQGYPAPFNVYLLSDNAKDYAAKRLRGEESYRIYAPLVRQTSEFLNRPTVTRCGGIQNPPTDANAPSTSNLGNPYVYELTANRLTRTGPYGKYRQQLEWQGVEFIDTDLYGTEDPPTAPNPTT